MNGERAGIDRVGGEGVGGAHIHRVVFLVPDDLLCRYIHELRRRREQFDALRAGFLSSGLAKSCPTFATETACTAGSRCFCSEGFRAYAHVLTVRYADANNGGKLTARCSWSVRPCHTIISLFRSQLQHLPKRSPSLGDGRVHVHPCSICSCCLQTCARTRRRVGGRFTSGTYPRNRTR